jgi:hypothetical protein
MYRVTIQSTPINESNWKVVAAGTWKPGGPQLEEHILSAEVVAELFNVIPSATDKSGRNQIQCSDTLYAVVFRRLSRTEENMKVTLNIPGVFLLLLWNNLAGSRSLPESRGC